MFADITAAQFSGVLDGIMELLPVVLPVVVSFIAFRKGWAWLKGQIKGA
jgi:hypothetical protein